MKVATVLARVLLGLAFTVFGLNFFLQFMPPPKLETGSLPEQFMKVMGGSGYMYVVGACQLVGGLLLLSGYLVPLGLTILAPVIVNIQLYHLFIDHAYNPITPMAAVPLAVAVLEIFLIWRYWPYFAPLFTVQATPRAKL